MKADPAWKRRILEPPRVDRVEAIGEQGVTLKILGSVRARAMGRRRRVPKRLLAALDANDIETPPVDPSPRSGAATARFGPGTAR